MPGQPGWCSVSVHCDVSGQTGSVQAETSRREIEIVPLARWLVRDSGLRIGCCGDAGIATVVRLHPLGGASYGSADQMSYPSGKNSSGGRGEEENPCFLLN
jgi:hypothetical protein